MVEFEFLCLLWRPSRSLVLISSRIREAHIYKAIASLGGGPQAHMHMEGMKCRVLYLNVLGMNALFL